MIKNLSKLINVKSLVTLSLAAVFSVLALNGTISGSDFQTIFSTVIAFYFGVQYEKREKEQDL